MTTKQIVNLPIAAGQYTEQTERGAEGRWYDMDKVRFRKGLAEKIGGWVQLSPSFLGTCRRIIDWSSLDGRRWTALGTDKKLYLWQDNSLYDITPLRDSGTLTNPFDTTLGSATVTVNHSNHGAQLGDYVRFENASAVGGITIDGEYEIQSIVDTNSYTITHSASATSAVSGGGGTVSYEYDISVGTATVTTGTGYGTGPYGREGYGNARTGSTLLLQIRTWALDTWGEDLLACPRGGGIYWWDRSLGTGNRATLLSDAPQTNQYMIISQRSRHVFALGAYDDINDKNDPLLIRWNSQEDLNDWEATTTNTAGDIRIYQGSKIVTAQRSRLEMLVWTDVSVHSIQYLSAGNFGIQTVGTNVSILGPNCAVPVDVRVFFMAESDFYYYDGILRVLPCDVRNLIYDNLNVDQRDKVYGGLNREFNEIWWFYPSFDPDAYLHIDTGLRLPDGFEVASPSSGGTIGYSYSFNSQGFTEVTGTAANGYEHDYFLTNDEPIIDPMEAEYAVEFDVNPSIAANLQGGLVFLKQDITGTANTTADDYKAFFVEVDDDNDLILIRKKEPDGTLSIPDNAGTGQVTGTSLLGSAITTGVKYTIVAQVDTPQITVWVNGEQAFQFNLSAQELTDHTGGSAGLHVRQSAANSNGFRFYNFAVTPVGVASATDFDISPVECNRYVLFNYEEGTWATGKLTRTAWQDRSPTLDKAFAASDDGYLYKHETGTDAAGSAMTAYVESFDFEIPDAGEYLMHVDQLIPDFLQLEGSVNVYLRGRKYPQADTLISKGPYTVAPGTTKISTRMRARQISLKIESTATGDRWRMGTWRGRVGAHGKR